MKKVIFFVALLVFVLFLSTAEHHTKFEVAQAPQLETRVTPAERKATPAPQTTDCLREHRLNLVASGNKRTLTLLIQDCDDRIRAVEFVTDSSLAEIDNLRYMEAVIGQLKKTMKSGQTTTSDVTITLLKDDSGINHYILRQNSIVIGMI